MGFGRGTYIGMLRSTYMGQVLTPKCSVSQLGPSTEKGPGCSFQAGAVRNG